MGFRMLQSLGDGLPFVIDLKPNEATTLCHPTDRVLIATRDGEDSLDLRTLGNVDRVVKPVASTDRGDDGGKWSRESCSQYELDSGRIEFRNQVFSSPGKHVFLINDPDPGALI